MSTPPRTTETMLAELVHHMAELSRSQKVANHYLAEILKALSKK